MNCPKCKTAELTPETFDNTEIDRCPRCAGMFLDRGELEQMIANQAGALADNPEFTVLSDKHDMMIGKCPRCEVNMEPTMGPANMRIDKCAQCEGVFLDQGELSAIRNR